MFLLPFLIYGAGTAALLWWTDQSATPIGSPRGGSVPDLGTGDPTDSTSPEDRLRDRLRLSADPLQIGEVVIVESGAGNAYRTPRGFIVSPSYVYGRVMDPSVAIRRLRVRRPDRPLSPPADEAITGLGLRVEGYSEAIGSASSAFPLVPSEIVAMKDRIIGRASSATPIASTSPPIGMAAEAGDMVVVDWAASGIPIPMDQPPPFGRPGPYAVFLVNSATDGRIAGLSGSTLQRWDQPLAEATPLSAQISAFFVPTNVVRVIRGGRQIAAV